MKNHGHISEIYNGHRGSSQKQGDQTSDYIETNEANDMGTNHYRSEKHKLINTIINTININFDGKEPGIGAVLGLRIKNIQKRHLLIFSERNCRTIYSELLITQSM